MATANSTANLITFTATNDTARSAAKVKVCGVLAGSASLTAAAVIRLQNAAGTLDIVPLTRSKSGLLSYQVTFSPPIEVTGLKAAACSSANMRVQLV